MHLHLLILFLFFGFVISLPDRPDAIDLENIRIGEFFYYSLAEYICIRLLSGLIIQTTGFTLCT
jgi:hypothetical protein